MEGFIPLWGIPSIHIPLIWPCLQIPLLVGMGWPTTIQAQYVIEFQISLLHCPLSYPIPRRFPRNGMAWDRDFLKNTCRPWVFLLVNSYHTSIPLKPPFAFSVFTFFLFRFCFLIFFSGLFFQQCVVSPAFRPCFPHFPLSASSLMGSLKDLLNTSEGIPNFRIHIVFPRMSKSVLHGQMII